MLNVVTEQGKKLDIKKGNCNFKQTQRPADIYELKICMNKSTRRKTKSAEKIKQNRTASNHETSRRRVKQQESRR